MANGLNKVLLIGNIGNEPEIRHTQNGTAVVNLRLAVNERRKQGDEWVDHTEWVSVVAFGKQAENADKYLFKGRQVCVEGRLQTREWTDKENVTRYSTEVVADIGGLVGLGKLPDEMKQGDKSTEKEPAFTDNRDKGKPSQNGKPSSNQKQSNAAKR